MTSQRTPFVFGANQNKSKTVAAPVNGQASAASSNIIFKAPRASGAVSIDVSKIINRKSAGGVARQSTTPASEVLTSQSGFLPRSRGASTASTLVDTSSPDASFESPLSHLNISRTRNDAELRNECGGAIADGESTSQSRPRKFQRAPRSEDYAITNKAKVIQPKEVREIEQPLEHRLQRRSRDVYEIEEDEIDDDDETNAAAREGFKKIKLESVDDTLALRGSYVPEFQARQGSHTTSICAQDVERRQHQHSSHHPSTPPRFLRTDEFEAYTMRQRQKEEELRIKWTKCTLEEWHDAGLDLGKEFSGLIELVRENMTTHIKSYSTIKERIENHKKTLEERQKGLELETQVLMQQTGKVVDLKGSKK